MKTIKGKNYQQIYKTVAELNGVEMSAYNDVMETIPELTNEDVREVHLSYSNKTNEIVSVQPIYSDKVYNEQQARIGANDEANAGNGDIVDSMNLLFANKHSREYQSAKKRTSATNDDVNRARRIVERRK